MIGNALAKLRSGNRRKIVGSALWVVIERTITLVTTFVTGIIVANHLGSEDFGTLSYAISLFAIFAAAVSTGLSGVVVKDLVRVRFEESQILGTVFAMRSAMAGVSVFMLVLISWVLDIGPPGSALLTTIIGIALFARALEVIDFWFQSHTRQRQVAIATFSGTVIGAISKLALVAIDAPLIAFAWGFVIETYVVSLFLFIFYKRDEQAIGQWKAERDRSSAYVKRAWPLMLSGIANVVSLRIDQVLLGAIAGASAAGTYAVAAKLSEIWYFIPVAIAGAAFPTLLRAKDRSEAEFRDKLRKLYAIFAWGAITLAAAVTLIAEPLIRTLYDEEFREAADVLVIHVWTAPFLFMGVVFSKWLIAEELLLMSLVRHGMAASLNIVLNLLLIPSHGPVGAAYATLISYSFAHYVACFLSPRTWPVAIDMTRGLLAPVEIVFKMVRKVLR